MSRLLFDNDRRPARGAGRADAGGDELFHGRSQVSIDDETGGARIRRRREDPSGRRSLTGLEFRRQRSI
jgi:hypothetical protein